MISFVLRRTLRKQFDTLDEDVTGLRELLADSSRMSPDLPEDVTITEADADGVPAEWVSYGKINPKQVILYLHGGGYIVGTPEGYRDLAWRIGGEAGRRMLLVDYRLAPENRFPAAVEDATTAYRWLLAEGHSPQDIVVGGDSAGGGLAMALLLNLKNLGVPLPAGAFLLSPWVDLTTSGDSMESNEKSDVMLTPGSLRTMASHYLGDLDPRAPLASPLYGDLSGLPPILVHASSSEVLLSDAERLVNRIRESGGEAQLDVFAKMPHVLQVLASRIPEGKTAITQVAEFIRARVP